MDPHPPNPPPGLFSWGRHKIPPAGPLIVHLGSLSIFVERRGDELWTRWVAEEKEGEGGPGEGPGSDWSRWAASPVPDEVEILPAFPDRPLVLQPEIPFHLLPEARARVYVRVPLWVQVRLSGKGGILLGEIPSLILSETWWGSFLQGELCYWLDIRARRMAPPEIYRPDRILCPLELTNKAREELPVEKLLLRGEHLSVFRGQGSLWSDEVRVRYRGEEVGSDLEMSGKPPKEAPGAPRLSTPRLPMAKGFTARTFARLRGLPGLGTAI